LNYHIHFKVMKGRKVKQVFPGVDISGKSEGIRMGKGG
jgi:hypothetical protein